MEKSVEKYLETDLACPWWSVCDSHKCWACVQACSERRARAREREEERLFDEELERIEAQQLAFWL